MFEAGISNNEYKLVLLSMFICKRGIFAKCSMHGMKIQGGLRTLITFAQVLERYMIFRENFSMDPPSDA